MIRSGSHPSTTAPIADPAHDNVYMVLDADDLKLLIDCGGSPSSRVAQAGLNFTDLDGLIVTHHHPDHIYGVPVLLMNLWFLGRRGTFPIYGPGKALGIMDLFANQYQGVGIYNKQGDIVIHNGNRLCEGILCSKKVVW